MLDVIAIVIRVSLAMVASVYFIAALHAGHRNDDAKVAGFAAMSAALFALLAATR